MLHGRALLLLALCASPASQSLASSSDWHDVEGGSIRFVTSGEPDADGALLGALEIRLKPGWKTYWRDPGDSGVPPSVAISADGDAPDIGFPAPTRFDDGYANWAGYDRPLALALTLHRQSGEPGPLSADIFLGVCETICVPVQASLSLDPAMDADNAEHAAVVAAAFAALPGPARPGFEVSLNDATEKTIALEAAVPASAKFIDLFVAGTDRTVIGPPRVDRTERGAVVDLPVRSAASGDTLHYTLVTTAGSVQGSIVLP